MTLPKDYRPPDPPSRFNKYKLWILVLVIFGIIIAISLYYGIKSYLDDSSTDLISFKLGISFVVSLIVFAVGRYVFDFKPETYASETKQ